MSEITRSPLCWPKWFPRTKNNDRIDGRFCKKDARGFGKNKLSINMAIQRLMHQVESFTRYGSHYRCDPDSVIISSDLELRSDGLPRSNQKRVDDPGVAVYFALDGKKRCIPCDVYFRVEDNIAAVAATIDALRTIERHGSKMFEAAFSGFDALPAPDHVMERGWRDVIDYYGDSLAEAMRAYFRARKKAHPDHGGSSEAFNEITKAWVQAERELKELKG